MTVYLQDIGVVCALGQGKAAVLSSLCAGGGEGMRPDDHFTPGRPLVLGRVATALPTVPPAFQAYASRNTSLLLAALAEIEAEVDRVLRHYGPARIGIVLGTSTSGIEEGERAVQAWSAQGQLPPSYHYQQQELGTPAAFLAAYLNTTGPALTISTACTSSGRALLTARRLLRLGVCDAVITGGVDSLCRLTVNGFSALEAVASGRCLPFSRHRDGINIGEAAVLFVMSREPGPVALLGAGASSDAHHMSAPEPSGRGAIQAMHQALVDAGLAAEAIAYVNLHGTGTRHNDAMESAAMAAVFPAGVPCSSTKPVTGHTLGAAGALEAAFCWLCLSAWNRDDRLPPHVWDEQPDPELPTLALVTKGERYRRGPMVAMMSNSYAFGGSNLSLVLGAMS